MAEKEYDVVIVGSGIAGAIIAKTLTRAKKTVLLLDAGLEAGMAMDMTGSHDAYKQYLQTFYSGFPKAPNAPYPKIKLAPSIDVLDLGGFKNGQNLTSYLVQKGPDPFTSDNVRAAGGTTLHWLGTTLRMLPNDFKMKKTYGHGVNWPFDYNSLKRYYEMAEQEIGVSGNVAEQQKIPGTDANYFGEDYLLPMQLIPPATSMSWYRQPSKRSRSQKGRGRQPSNAAARRKEEIPLRILVIPTKNCAGTRRKKYWSG
jgi:choline dehydrogenase-like flavoprotein